MRGCKLSLVFLLTLLPLCILANNKEKDKSKKHTKNSTEESSEKHHQFEVEISYNDAKHFELTGSVYFAHLTKIQGTIEDTGHHYAAVLVRELPFKRSKFGTFFGVGTSFGFEKEDVHTEAEHENLDNSKTHNKWETNLIIQSGLAYSIDESWSTGFTVSPGYCIQTQHPMVGMTLDLVFAF